MAPRCYAGLLGIAGVLAGCAAGQKGVDGLTTAEREARAGLAAAPVCCRSLGDMAWQALPAGSAVPVLFDDKATAFEFDTGKSYFAAFRLPAIDRPAVLKVGFWPRLTMGPSAGPVLPQVVFLDDAYHTVRMTQPSDFQFAPEGRMVYEASLPLAPGGAERLALIRTTNDYLKRSLPSTGGVGYLFTGPADPDWYQLPAFYRLRFTPVGKVSVELSR